MGWKSEWPSRTTVPTRINRFTTWPVTVKCSFFSNLWTQKQTPNFIHKNLWLLLAKSNNHLKTILSVFKTKQCFHIMHTASRRMKWLLSSHYTLHQKKYKTECAGHVDEEKNLIKLNNTARHVSKTRDSSSPWFLLSGQRALSTSRQRSFFARQQQQQQQQKPSDVLNLVLTNLHTCVTTNQVHYLWGIFPGICFSRQTLIKSLMYPDSVGVQQ